MVRRKYQQPTNLTIVWRVWIINNKHRKCTSVILILWSYDELKIPIKPQSNKQVQCNTNVP